MCIRDRSIGSIYPKKTQLIIGSSIQRSQNSAGSPIFTAIQNRKVIHSPNREVTPNRHVNYLGPMQNYGLNHYPRDGYPHRVQLHDHDERDQGRFTVRSLTPPPKIHKRYEEYYQPLRNNAQLPQSPSPMSPNVPSVPLPRGLIATDTYTGPVGFHPSYDPRSIAPKKENSPSHNHTPLC
eukprot:TRINITY_DN2780_c0_g1_i5.p1 TRINITY_DN2780_c0_g1~~TRINITY_DN2780_c0_g1_i5.p1  ORF type:complete len:180 (+),score=1.01 TRINITY_DN2780_c0_g1_i5:67-606(+)